MSLSMIDWDRRFRQQAHWTAELRHYLFDLTGLVNASRVLEVGCGTGAILADLALNPSTVLHGLDINSRHLALARRQAPGCLFASGDAHRLPYPTGVFDLVFCHFLLLWVEDPAQALGEMRRVTRPGGAVLAMAEPDYGGRVDYPSPLAQLGAWQTEALRQQGADPHVGRRLAALFRGAGLEQVETGVLGGRWSGRIAMDELDGEWEVIRADLGALIPESTLQELYEIDRLASTRGERILYVPTFYAHGINPGHAANQGALKSTL